MGGLQEVSFYKGVTKLEDLPCRELPEIAFIGRSNVGKSSLINALTQKKKLARTSKTPGRTQELNFFLAHNTFYIVDLPGYGFAQAPEHKVFKWQTLVAQYLRGRPTLKRVFILVDARHGFKKIDDAWCTLLNEAAVSFQIILTKCDKISPTQLQEIEEKTKKTAASYTACYPSILLTSSVRHIGLEELIQHILHSISDYITPESQKTLL